MSGAWRALRSLLERVPTDGQDPSPIFTESPCPAPLRALLQELPAAFRVIDRHSLVSVLDALAAPQQRAGANTASGPLDMVALADQKQIVDESRFVWVPVSRGRWVASSPSCFTEYDDVIEPEPITFDRMLLWSWASTFTRVLHPAQADLTIPHIGQRPEVLDSLRLLVGCTDADLLLREAPLTMWSSRRGSAFAYQSAQGQQARLVLGGNPREIGMARSIVADL